MTQYIWTIDQCKRVPETGFINEAFWRCDAIDGVFVAAVRGTCTFADGTPTIPYNEVTQQDVLDWCWANVLNKE